MARIVTALTAQKRHPDRVNVSLDGEFAFGLSRIVAAWLQVGQALSEEDILRLEQRETKEAATQSALRLLSYKPRSETEIRRRLEKKGFSPAVVEETITRLRENGMLNDRQFAADWVENQSTFRPRGRRLLRYEMHQKGLDDESIQQALDQASDEDELAYQAGLRRAQIHSGLDWHEFRLKLIQFLARRGFSYGVAAKAVSRLWKEVKTQENGGA